jgi:hypothetical protein
MSKRCHREDDDDEGGGARLPTIAESMGDVPVSVAKRGPKFLAYARYDDKKVRPIQWTLTWNQPPDPLENLVCLNGKYAAKLARAIAVNEREIPSSY